MYIDGIGEIGEDLSEEEIVEIKRLLAEKVRLEEENGRLESKINEFIPQTL